MADETTPLTGGNGTSPEEDPYADSEFKDPVSEMTFGRRMARYLSRYAWYNPNAHKKTDGDDVEGNAVKPPSLDKGWEYFEHYTLSRQFVSASGNRESMLRKGIADAGEKQFPTKLFPVFDTTEEQLIHFGMGVSMYFSTLQSLALIFFVAGCINIPNLIYFASDYYNHGNLDLSYPALQASAICTDQIWKACPTCTYDDWDHFPVSHERYANYTTADGEELTFIQISNCDVNRWVGRIAFASLMFVCVAIYIILKGAKFRENQIDLSAQTATDYTVEIHNPPHHSRDPEKWREYFESNWGPITCLTIGLDNEDLLINLLRRRLLCLELKNLQPANGVVDVKNPLAAVETALPLTGIQKWIGREASAVGEAIKELDEKIAEQVAEAEEKPFDVTHIFATFETEEAQQQCLEDLNTASPLQHLLVNKSALKTPNHLYDQTWMMFAKEPAEPSSIRWQDLDESIIVMAGQRLLTLFLTIAVIVAGAFTVSWVRYKYGIGYAALAITAFNSIAPALCQEFTKLEAHSHEGSWQASLYYKITACLWTLSTLLTAFVTPFAKTLDNDVSSLIPSMYAIFITEMLKSPVTQLLDIAGNVNRHIFAPRALDEFRLKACFLGGYYQLSERYTNMTNVLFMTFYYALIFPAGFFFGAITLYVRYWVDKFCLLRVWAKAPRLGSTIADLSRNWFFTTALAVYAIMSSYNFASFPYDNSCPLENRTVTSEYVGTFTTVDGEGDPVTFTIPADSIEYKFCNQDMLRYRPWPAFPAVPSRQPEGGEWMGPEQDFTKVFGWASIFVLLFIGIIFVRIFIFSIYKFIFGDFTPHLWKLLAASRPPPPTFSEVLVDPESDIRGYIPQFTLSGMLHPTLLCDISNIDHELIGWEVEEGYEVHNVIYDREVLDGKSLDLFSTVNHYPPIKKDD